MKLQGKIIVVTGGSRGLGRAICEDLQAHGATVVSCSAHRSPVCDYVVDVRSFASVKKFVASVKKKYGRIDVLINNAGWLGSTTLLEKVSPAEYTRTMDTNVRGVFHCLSAILPVMKKQKEGIIVNIASRAGKRSHPTLSVYSASKAAVISLTQGVAKELRDVGSKVRCFSFSPRGINTDMRRKVFGSFISKRDHSPKSIAALLIFCLGDSSIAPSGANVQVTPDGKTETILME